MGLSPAPRRDTISRFALGGALAGMLAGLAEAALLYFVPRIPTLLKPDTDAVIWTVAPLMDLCLFGLIGAALGWLATRGRVPSPTRILIAAAVLLGLAAGWVAWAFDLLRVQMADLRAQKNLATALLVFCAVFAVVIAMGALIRRRHAWLLAPLGRAPVRHLAKAVAAVVLIFLAGFGVLLLRHPDRLQRKATGPARSPGLPNIVLITLDTVRADHLSLYGYHRSTTPNLERLAKRGVVFESAMAPCSWTLPSHSSIFTGLLPHQHGANSVFPLPQGPRTLAEILRTLGYATAGFNANAFYGQVGWGLAQGFDVYEDEGSSLRYNVARTVAGRALLEPLYYYLIRPDYLFRRNARELNRDIMRWVGRLPRGPYFLFVNYMDAHYPYQAPGEFATRFGASPGVPARRPDALDGGHATKPLSPTEQAALITGYDNSLAYLDDQVAKLVKFLAARPDGANTVLIITADHGEAFGEHGTYDHGWDLYREVLHVPLIITGPGVPAGIRVSHLARLREVFPTVLEWVLGEQAPFDRLSLRRFWKPGFQPDEFDDMAIAEVTPSFPESKLPMSISFMTSEWHYIHQSDGRSELYHWTSDPQETLNLAATPADQTVLETLRNRLDRAVGHSVRPWDGIEYLYAQDAPGYSFLQDLAFRSSEEAGGAHREPPLGGSQAYFTRDVAPGPSRPPLSDEELLRSLPYH